MNLRPLLKATLMLALVIAGRYTRDLEQHNPGRSLTEIMQTPPTLPAPTATRLPARAAAVLHPVALPQAASFSDLD